MPDVAGPIYTRAMLDTAIRLFDGALAWYTYTGNDGKLTVEFPSSQRGPCGGTARIYRASEHRCDCPGFHYHHGMCSHVLAVKLYIGQERARGRARRSAGGRDDD